MEAPALQVSSLVGRPGLAAVSLSGRGDGVAYVGRLIACALRSLVQHEIAVVELEPSRVGRVSVRERLSFGARLYALQRAGRADWWLFNHVGIARVQHWLPRHPPYAVFLYGIEAWTPGLSRQRRAVLQRAHVRIAISGYTAGRVAAAYPEIGAVHSCPLSLLPDDERSPQAIDAALLARVSPNSVLIVGRMSSCERYKGHDALLESWPAVLERIPTAQLVVVGQGDDLDRLRRKAHELEIQDRVLFTGFVDDATLERLRMHVALFAMPSRGEGFGIVYLEAMRAGLPCIGSTVDAAGEIILDGVTGHLVPPQAPDALASVIGELLDSPSRRALQGAAGRQRYEAEFTFPRFLARFNDILAIDKSEATMVGV